MSFIINGVFINIIITSSTSSSNSILSIKGHKVNPLVIHERGGRRLIRKSILMRQKM